MTGMWILIVVLAAVGLAFVLAGRYGNSPESTSTHRSADGADDDSASDDLYSGVDRPAGPDATTMDPDALGGDQSPPRRGGPKS